MPSRCLLGLALASWILGQAASLAGEKKTPAQNPAIQANNDFACTLYRELGQEHAGKNVFFSPYSISSALAMTLEGARGETAEEMGRVLRLPESLHDREGAKVRPWKMAPHHLGFNALNRRLNERPDSLKDQATRDKLKELRRDLDKINAQVQAVQKNPKKFADVFKLQNQAQTLAAAINKLSQQVDQYEVRVANAVWSEKTYPFDQDYFDAISKYYGSDVLRNANFRGDFTAERAKINRWVEQQTNDRIKDLIPNYPRDFAERIRMILVNAIFFKGQWATPFDVKLTKNEDFLLADGGKKPTSMMHVHHKQARYAAFNADGSLFDTPAQIPFQGGDKIQKYPDRDGFLVAEVPVKGEKISMVVIAPQKADGLPALEARLSGANLSAWLDKLQRRLVDVAVPRFKMETDFSLADTLKKMGMKLAFAEREADFTGMSTSRNPDDRLSIGAVLHKAFVEVNEQGAEAAAATAVIMVTPTSAPVGTPFTPSFRADRPFLFLFRDVDTGAVLFLGRMTVPPSASKS